MFEITRVNCNLQSLKPIGVKICKLLLNPDKPKIKVLIKIVILLLNVSCARHKADNNIYVYEISTCFVQAI